jgi:hypothetical protein
MSATLRIARRISKYLGLLLLAALLVVFASVPLARWEMHVARHKQAFLDSLELHYLNPFMRFMEANGSVSRWLSASDDLRDSLDERHAFLQRVTLALREACVNLVAGSDTGTGNGLTSHVCGPFASPLRISRICRFAVGAGCENGLT